MPSNARNKRFFSSSFDIGLYVHIPNHQLLSRLSDHLCKSHDLPRLERAGEVIYAFALGLSLHCIRITKISLPDGFSLGNWDLLQRNLAGGQTGVHHVEDNQGPSQPGAARGDQLRWYGHRAVDQLWHWHQARDQLGWCGQRTPIGWLGNSLHWARTMTSFYLCISLEEIINYYIIWIDHIELERPKWWLSTILQKGVDTNTCLHSFTIQDILLCILYNGVQVVTLLALRFKVLLCLFCQLQTWEKDGKITILRILNFLLLRSKPTLFKT